MERVKVGVIGVGQWGTSHVEAYLGLPHVEVIAVADTAPKRAEQVAKAFGISRWFDTHEELCALPDLDAVSIVTPEADHLKAVESAARAGKHMLVEKPMAHSVAEIDRMIAAARQAGVILIPGHLLRFETRYAMVKDMLENREMGAVVSIQARRNRTRGNFEKYARAHPLFAVGVHDIDLLLWYSGSTPARVRGFQRNIQSAQTPNVVWGIIEFANGVLASVETTWLTPNSVGIFSNDALQLVTDKGIAVVDLVPGGLSFWLESGFYVPDISYGPRIRGQVKGALEAELSHFISCVLEGKQSQVITPEEAREGIRIAVALIESASKEHDIILDERDAMTS